MLHKAVAFAASLALVQAASAKTPARHHVPPVSYSNWLLKTQTDSLTDEVMELAILNNGGDQIAITCWPSKPENGVALVFIPEQGIQTLKRMSGYEVYPADARFDSMPVSGAIFEKENIHLRLL